MITGLLENYSSGRRDIIIGETLALPPHNRTLYTGRGIAGDDPHGFQNSNESCPSRAGAVLRKATTRIPRLNGTLSYVGIGLAICTDPHCQYPAVVTVNRYGNLEIVQTPDSR